MLKYTYEKEADVPAEHKALYQEKDFELPNGEKKKLWVLQVEDVVHRARFVEFRDRNISLQKENEGLKEKFKDISDPDKARALIKIAGDIELDDAEKYLKKGGVDAMITERTKAMKEDMEKKLADERAAKVLALARLDKTIIENHLLEVCSKLQLQQGAEVAILKLADGLWKHVAQANGERGQIVMLDNQGNPRSSGDGTGNLGVAEWLQTELLKKHPYLVKESSGGGAGGSGSGGAGSQNNVNPWKKETYNLTQQAIITKADSARAARLKEAAGVRTG